MIDSVSELTSLISGVVQHSGIGPSVGKKFSEAQYITSNIFLYGITISNDLSPRWTFAYK